MHLTRRIHMQRTHIKQLPAAHLPHQPMLPVPYTPINDMPVPAGDAVVAAQHELDGRVQQFQGMYKFGALGELPQATGLLKSLQEHIFG